MSSTTALSSLTTVLGLVLLLGAIGLLTSRWGTASQRSVTISTQQKQQNSMKVLTVKSQHPREPAVQRQDRLRWTEAAENTSFAALNPVQSLYHGHHGHTDHDQHLLSVHSTSYSASSPEPQISASHLSTIRAAAEDTKHGSSGSHEGFGTTAGMPADMRALDSQLSAKEVAARCRTTIGEWCQHALKQQAVSDRSQPISGSQTCHSDCNGVGNCNALTGICDCPAGGTRLSIDCSNTCSAYSRRYLHCCNTPHILIRRCNGVCRLEG